MSDKALEIIEDRYDDVEKAIKLYDIIKEEVRPDNIECCIDCLWLNTGFCTLFYKTIYESRGRCDECIDIFGNKK